MGKSIVEINTSQRKKWRELASEIGLLKAKLMRNGLLMTFHAMDKAVLTIGYEIEALENDTWPDSCMKAV